MTTNPSPTPPRTTFHHGHLADALVAAASAYIAAERSVAFSLRQIAEAVGVSHTAAYRHFRSKQDLIAELAIRGFVACRKLCAAPRLRQVTILPRWRHPRAPMWRMGWPIPAITA